MMSAFLSFPGTVLVHSFFMKNTWYVNWGIDPAMAEARPRRVSVPVLSTPVSIRLVLEPNCRILPHVKRYRIYRRVSPPPHTRKPSSKKGEMRKKKKKNPHILPAGLQSLIFRAATTKRKHRCSSAAILVNRYSRGSCRQVWNDGASLVAFSVG